MKHLKKILAIILAFCLTTVLSGCNIAEKILTSKLFPKETILEQDTEEIEPVEESVDEAEEQSEVEEKPLLTTDAVFEQLPEEFFFSSGAGGWETRIQVKSDGSFTGKYYDSDMGVTGPGYSNGTVYICEFNGKFAEAKPVNDHIYSTEVEFLNIARAPEEEYYEDDTRYITSEPYGFDHAEEFLIYLPGTPMAELPNEFLGWSFLNRDLPKTPSDYYGIYNVSGQTGFVGIVEDSLWNHNYVYHFGNKKTTFNPSYYSDSRILFFPDNGAATIDLQFVWCDYSETNFKATDNRGSGAYNVTLNISEDRSTVEISLESINGNDLSAWGGSSDGKFRAVYQIEEE